METLRNGYGNCAWKVRDGVLHWREAEARLQFGNAIWSLERAQEFNYRFARRIGVRAKSIIAEPQLIRRSDGRVFMGLHENRRMFGRIIIATDGFGVPFEDRDLWAITIHEVAHYRISGHPNQRFKQEMRMIHDLWWDHAPAAGWLDGRTRNAQRSTEDR